MSVVNQVITVKEVESFTKGRRVMARSIGSCAYVKWDEKKSLTENYDAAANKLKGKLGFGGYWVSATDYRGDYVYVNVAKSNLKHIHISVKAYRDKTYGNTYTSYAVWVIFMDGTEKVYSGGPAHNDSVDQSRYSSVRLLEDVGLFKDIKHYPSGGCESIWGVCDRLGIKYSTSVEWFTRLAYVRQETPRGQCI